MKLNKDNLLFGLLVSCLLALPLLSEEDDTLQRPSINASSILKSNNQTRYGWFFGAGLGIGLERMEYNHGVNNTTQPNAKQDRLQRDSFANYSGSLKVGGYVYFNPYVAIRSYLGYEVSLTPNTKPLSKDYRAYETMSLNLDFIFNAYVSEKIDFGFILGGGIDHSLVTYRVKNGSIFGDPRDARGSRNIMIEPQAKFGLRTLVSKKYGIELIAKLPLIPHYTPVGDWNANLSTNGVFSTTLNFVMEL